MRKHTLLLTLGFLLISSGIYACSCIGRHTVKEEIRNSDAVLLGTVISKDLVRLVDSNAIKMHALEDSPTKGLYETVVAKYQLVLTSKYKGKTSTDTVEIYTGLGNGDCGVRFEIGKNYIIYGSNSTYLGQLNNDTPYPKGKNIFWTNTCSRTTLENQKEIQEIEKHRKKR